MCKRCAWILVCRYGLSHSSIVPEHLRQNDNGQRAAETRARLEEATRKREEEEKAKAAQRHQKREYRTGQLTGEVAAEL